MYTSLKADYTLLFWKDVHLICTHRIGMIYLLDIGQYCCGKWGKGHFQSVRTLFTDNILCILTSYYHTNTVQNYNMTYLNICKQSRRRKPHFTTLSRKIEQFFVSRHSSIAQYTHFQVFIKFLWKKNEKIGLY